MEKCINASDGFTLKYTNPNFTIQTYIFNRNVE